MNEKTRIRCALGAVAAAGITAASVGCQPVSATLAPPAAKKSAATRATAAKPPARPAAPKSANSPKGSALAEKAVAQLKKDEARVKSGRISLHVAQRQVDLPEGTQRATVRSAIAKAPVGTQRREYLLFSGDDWKRDVTVMDAQGDTQAHYLVGVAKDLGRVLQETGRAEKLERVGQVGPQPDQTAPDRLLVMRGADLLEGITWSSAKPSKGLMTLSGTRGEDRVTAILRTAPRYALEKLMMAGDTVTPQGPVARGQELKITHEVTKSGLALKSVEHLIYITGALNRGMLSTYKIEGSQINVPVRPEELTVDFPAGTLVADGRFDPPVRYKQGDRELTLAEVKALHEKQAARFASVGKPAPEVQLKTLDGKEAKLSEHRGKVVLLNWFASW